MNLYHEQVKNSCLAQQYPLQAWLLIKCRLCHRISSLQALPVLPVIQKITKISWYLRKIAKNTDITLSYWKSDDPRQNIIYVNLDNGNGIWTYPEIRYSPVRRSRKWSQIVIGQIVPYLRTDITFLILYRTKVNNIKTKISIKLWSQYRVRV